MNIRVNQVRRFIGSILFSPGNRRQILFGSLFLSSAIIIFFGLMPTIFSLYSNYTKLTHGREIDRSMKVKIENLNKAREKLNKFGDSLKLVDRALPNDKDLPKLLEDLNYIFSSNNVLLEEINFSTPRPSKLTEVLTLPLKIRISGNYENIDSSLNELEKNPRQIDIQEINLDTPFKGDAKFLKVSLEIETYFIKTARGIE